MYQRVMTGPKPTFADGEPPRPTSRSARRSSSRRSSPSFLLLGFFPKPVLDLVNPAVDRTLHIVGVTDPLPANASGSEK